MLAAPRLWLDRNGFGATSWVDCVPGRIDLPRTLPEMPVLGIAPLSEDDAVPASDGWCYRRTTRPGQGRLTHRPTIGLCIVLISPKHDTAEAAGALRDWADFVHISHIAAAGVPGYTMITPYELEPADAAGPRYLHLYEMDDDDPEARFQAMTPLVRKRLADDRVFEDWAWHPELRIDFVSTYLRRSPATQAGSERSSAGSVARTSRRVPAMSDFFEIVLKQRACRDFRDEPIPDDDIEHILRAATHAPSVENTQPWAFIVVRDDAVRTALSDLTRRLWSAGGRDYAAAHNTEHLFNEVDGLVERGLGGAPVFVVVAADSSARAHPTSLGSSIFPAVQNLLLAANALGYGSALTTLTTYGGDELRNLLDLPEHVTPMAIVPLGRPARPLGPPRRRPVAESTYRDRFGTPW